MKSLPPTAKSGYTLVEIMIAMAIMVSVLAMSMGFLMESTLINFRSSAKNEINRELRNVINNMAIEAKQANLFLMYASAADADRHDRGDRLRPNESGDALLLVFNGPHVPSADVIRDPRPITRMIMYYRDSNTVEDGVAWGPVMRWERDFSSSPVTVIDEDENSPPRDLEALIPAIGTLRNESRQVVAFSEGLVNGRLFFNYQNRTVMINGRIRHGNEAKWITDTYNFSISPRG